MNARIKSKILDISVFIKKQCALSVIVFFYIAGIACFWGNPGTMTVLRSCFFFLFALVVAFQYWRYFRKMPDNVTLSENQLLIKEKGKKIAIHPSQIVKIHIPTGLKRRLMGSIAQIHYTEMNQNKEICFYISDTSVDLLRSWQESDDFPQWDIGSLFNAFLCLLTLVCGLFLFLHLILCYAGIKWFFD